MYSIRSIFAIIALGGTLLGSNAQVTTSCSPLGGVCPNDKGLASSSYSIDFTSVKTLPSEWVLADNAEVTLGTNGAELSFKKRFDAPTMRTDFNIFFGRVEYVVQAAPGTGIISSMVMLSDDLDEVDWEFRGGITDSVQTNYFGKGYTGTYNRSTTESVTSPQATFHTYTVDWSPTALAWSIDGKVMRTLNAADADGNGSRYPQTPMKISLSLWDGGDPDKNPATVEWAGGVTPLPPKQPWTMYVKSVKIWNSNPGQQYQYSDKSGSWKSIKVINETMTSSSSTAAQSTHTLSLAPTTPVSTTPTGLPLSNTTSTGLPLSKTNSTGLPLSNTNSTRLPYSNMTSTGPRWSNGTYTGPRWSNTTATRPPFLNTTSTGLPLSNMTSSYPNNSFVSYQSTGTAMPTSSPTLLVTSLGSSMQSLGSSTMNPTKTCSTSTVTSAQTTTITANATAAPTISTPASGVTSSSPGPSAPAASTISNPAPGVISSSPGISYSTLAVQTSYQMSQPSAVPSNASLNQPTPVTSSPSPSEAAPQTYTQSPSGSTSTDSISILPQAGTPAVSTTCPCAAQAAPTVSSPLPPYTTTSPSVAAAAPAAPSPAVTPAGGSSDGAYPGPTNSPAGSDSTTNSPAVTPAGGSSDGAYPAPTNSPADSDSTTKSPDGSDSTTNPAPSATDTPFTNTDGGDTITIIPDSATNTPDDDTTSTTSTTRTTSVTHFLTLTGTGTGTVTNATSPPYPFTNGSYVPARGSAASTGVSGSVSGYYSKATGASGYSRATGVSGYAKATSSPLPYSLGGGNSVSVGWSMAVVAGTVAGFLVLL